MPNKAAAICVFGLYFKQNQSDEENEVFLNGMGIVSWGKS